jgi:cytochrome c553
MRRPLLAFAAASLAAQLGLAGAALAEADPEAGRSVVVGGRHATVTPCFTCHGLDGVGDGSGAFPRLTGQMPFYLYKQLLDYAAGTRPNDIMSPIARELSEQQMQDVAAYYATAEAPHRPPPEVAPEVLERGRTIAEEGLEKAGVQACVYCHGEDGIGLPPSFPYLMGQYAPYTELQLLFWKRDVRKNDPLNVMEQIAKRLSDEDIRAVALYFETRRPPATEETADPPAGADAAAPTH